MDNPKTDTLILRRDRYDYAVQRCTYVGGGIGGLLVLVGLNANAINNSPNWLRALVITLIVLSGAAIGRAYIGFSSAKQDTFAIQKRSNLADDNLAEDVHPYPRTAYASYSIAIILFILSAIFVIVGAWWQEPQKTDSEEQSSGVVFIHHFN
jgi:hypothetical protein